MTLRDAIDEYIGWQRLHGAKFVTSGRVLQQFSRIVGDSIRCDRVSDRQVLDFLAGNGPLTRTRSNKHGALAGFYRYAISRGYADRAPLPDNEPREPKSAPPYIFQHDELRRMFRAVDVCQRRATKLDAYTFRTLLLLLYGTGLRIGEARRLALVDVDLQNDMLTVRSSKFHRTRLVPVGPQLAGPLRAYATDRANRPCPAGMDSAFLAYRDGTAMRRTAVETAFARLLGLAGVHCSDGVRRNPSLHGMRHTFAVHRLTSWYRQGANVQRLLPVLSTYLGHVSLDGTRVYLSMTPELLQQASIRFDHHVNGGYHA